MSDSRLPEPSNEFLSSRPQAYSKNMQILVKNYKGRLQLAHTLGALTAVKQDIGRSNVQQNFSAKEELRTIANARAKEIGFKEPREWWS